jgi:hypothetical protein
MQSSKKFRNDALEGSAANSLKQQLSRIHKTMSIALAPRQVLLLVVLVVNVVLTILILLVPLLAITALLLVAVVPLLVVTAPLRCVSVLLLIPLETLLVWKRSFMTLITMGTEKHGRGV